jgi:dTDP-4-dehydrorhamnose reductase
MKIKVCIVGAGGSLGHILSDVLNIDDNILTCLYKKNSLSFEKSNNIKFCLDLSDFESVSYFFSNNNFDVIINCAINYNENSPEFFLINSVLPYIILKNTSANTKIINISSDIFYTDGAKASSELVKYVNLDTLYGYSKLFGEIYDKRILNLRTSFIGPSSNNKGFYYQATQFSEVFKFYSNHYFNGLTTLELSKVISNIIKTKTIFDVYGYFNLGSHRISRFDLSCIIRSIRDLPTPSCFKSEINIDRTMCTRKFNEYFNYAPPQWHKMLEELYDYEKSSTLPSGI